MKARPKKKFQMILSRELAMARSAAVQVMKPKPFSVWEVLIPIIFILSYMRTKEQRELFVQNLMFTKSMALEAAFEIVNENKKKEEVLAGIDHKTKTVLNNVGNGIYSEGIRQCQMAEMDLLIDHYHGLLKEKGEKYSTLVVNAYQTKNNYSKFIYKLKDAEKKVTSAASKTLGDKTDTSTLTRLESVIDSIRLKEADEIFGMDQMLNVE
jgi:hypothetical protein